jgi:imidazolonepropionase
MQKLLTHIRMLGGIHESTTKYLRGTELDQFHAIENAWLLIEGGRILDFGPMASCPPQKEGMEAESLEGKMLLPAFIDSHTHLVFADWREGEFEDRLKGLSYQEIAERGGGILNSAAKLRVMPENELFERSLHRLKEVISSGTGAIEIKSGYGLDLESELKMLRVIRRLKEDSGMPIRSTFLGAHAVPAEFKGDAGAYLQVVIKEMLPAVAKEHLADYVDIFCEKGYFSLDHTKQLLEAAAKYGLKPKIHVNQFNAMGGVGAGIQFGAISVDHLEEMNAEDYELLAASETVATALPGCSHFLGIPYTPLRELINQNAIVSVASDFNPGSAPSGNMQQMMSLACIKQKLTPAEAFNACTLNAAFALEWSDELGSITRGKRANLMLLSAPSLAHIPYAFGSNHVERMMVNGEWEG